MMWVRVVFLIFLLSRTHGETFEPKVVTPQPVTGFRSFPFFDEHQHVKRELVVWYPVGPEMEGVPSKDPWDLFNIALNAPLASSAQKRPVVVVSHGYTGNPHQLSWLVRGLVYHGYIVLAIQHRDLVNGKAHVNHWRRAQDVTVILNHFAKEEFSKGADLDKVGISGFSLGGTTSIWVAGGRATKLDSLVPGPEYAAPEDYVRADEALPTLNKEMMAKDWREERIKAAFIMAPGWAWLFDEESLRNVTIPTYIIAAAEDKVLVTKNNAGFFARYIPKSFYQEIRGKGSHYIFISAVNSIQRKKADPSNQLTFLFDDNASVDRRWIQFQVAEEAARFFSSVFKWE